MRLTRALVLDLMLPNLSFEDKGGCWVWTAGCDGEGYGSIHLNGKVYGTHRIMWMICVGPIPKKLTIDHAECENKPCCNPSHLEVVTRAENIRRARGIRNGECQRGHEMTGWNVQQRSDGRISCRTCKNAAVRRSQAKVKGEKWLLG